MVGLSKSRNSIPYEVTLRKPGEKLYPSALYNWIQYKQNNSIERERAVTWKGLLYLCCVQLRVWKRLQIPDRDLRNKTTIYKRSCY